MRHGNDVETSNQHGSRAVRDKVCMTLLAFDQMAVDEWDEQAMFQSWVQLWCSGVCVGWTVLLSKREAIHSIATEKWTLTS